MENQLLRQERRVRSEIAKDNYIRSIFIHEGFKIDLKADLQEVRRSFTFEKLKDYRLLDSASHERR